MRASRPMSLGLLAATVLALAGRPQTVRAADRPAQFINGVRDSGQFLPDTTWLVKVGPRITRVRDYCEQYYATHPEYRPAQDSLGRVTFLNDIINRDVLGMTARKLNVPLGFEDRLAMRENTERVLANTVYRRLVMDSVKVTEDEVRAAGQQFAYDERFRHILFDDRTIAERVRRDLLGGRISWSAAVKRYSQAKDDKGPDGELGWAKRTSLEPDFALRIFGLKPGEMSQVFADKDGFQLVQALERKPVPPPSLDALRNSLRTQIANLRGNDLADAIQEILRREIGLAYDTTNIRFTAARFHKSIDVDQSDKGTNVTVDAEVPDFGEDTSRVLARWRDGGRITLQAVMRAYTDLPPMVRPNMNFFDAVRGQVDAIVLQPYMAQYAIRRGLDKDSTAVALIEKRREALMVDHLYQDSVGSKVYVSKDERRAYYEQNKTKFVTYPSVDFAAIVRPTHQSAESLETALKAGAKAADVLLADSLGGKLSGLIHHRRQDEGGPYQKILFEELRPGGTTILGPDKEGTFLVLQLVQYDRGRQLSFEESDAMADESMQNIKAEALTKGMLERMRAHYKIDWRPELVMKIKLVDPTL